MPCIRGGDFETFAAIRGQMRLFKRIAIALVAVVTTSTKAVARAIIIVVIVIIIAIETGSMAGVAVAAVLAVERMRSVTHISGRRRR